MLFTNPRTGRAIAEGLRRRQHNPFNTGREGAPLSGEQIQPSPATRITRTEVWRLFRRSPRAAR